jgi:hypothetical protein
MLGDCCSASPYSVVDDRDPQNAGTYRVTALTYGDASTCQASVVTHAFFDDDGRSLVGDGEAGEGRRSI